MQVHTELGFIDIRKLVRGTLVLLKTVDEVYEIEVGTPKRSVVLVASDGRFFSREKRVVSGSVCPDTGVFLPYIIGKGLCVRLQKPYHELVLTGPVVAAKVTGPDKTYTYELWNN